MQNKVMKIMLVLLALELGNYTVDVVILLSILVFLEEVDIDVFSLLG